MNKMKELRSTNRQLQNSHGDVKYSIGNTVNNILTMYDDLLGCYIMSNHRGVHLKLV